MTILKQQMFCLFRATRLIKSYSAMDIPNVYFASVFLFLNAKQIVDCMLKIIIKRKHGTKYAKKR